MPFPSELTAGQLIQLRQRHHTAQQFMLLTPNTVIWQTQSAAQVDGSIPFASFQWDGTDAGDRADVKVGMTVLVSTSTDYRTTTIFRGRVRLAPDDTTFYINETSVNLETTYTITVIDDYDLHERLERRTADGARFIDWDKVFVPLPPVISGLQSVYADLSGAASVSLSFAPTVTPFAAGAANDAYLWDVADGTITAGSSSTKDITVSFPGAATNEHRWVRFETTDDNGTTQYFVFEVYTIDPTDTDTSVIKLGTGDVNITNSRTDGWSATVRAWQGVDTVLDRTRCAVASLDDYDGVRALTFTSGGTTEIEVGDTIEGATSEATADVVAVDLDSGTWAGGDAAGRLWIKDQTGTFEAENLDVGAGSNLATIAADSVNPPLTQTVAFVGRLRLETNVTRGDEIHAQLQDTTFTIEGFATQLGHVIGPGLYLLTATSPAEWGQIGTMTVGRALIYMMAHYSTFLNLCSFSLPSDIQDYDWFEYSIPPAAMLPWVTSVSDDINAYMIWAASGECTAQRHASYAGVSGLDTVFTLAVDDSGDSDMSEVSLTLDYVPTRAAAIIGAATYNTTTEEAPIYQGRAPAQVYGPGWETDPLNQQIMKSDLSEANAISEAGARVSAHLAYVNLKAQIQAHLPSGYYWITASDHILYAFDIAASENTRGRAYTSSKKWLCTGISYTYNADDGYYDPVATFEEVTTGGNYGITVTQVVDVTDLTPPDLPPGDAGLGPGNPIINYPVDDPDYELPGFGGGVLEPGNPPSVPVGCDLLNVSMRTGNQVATHNNSVFGETYVVQVEGDGLLSDNSWTEVIDATVTLPGNITITQGSQSGSGIAGSTTGLSPTAYRIVLDIDMTGASSLTQALTVYDRTNPAGAEDEREQYIGDFGGAGQTLLVLNADTSTGTDINFEWTGSFSNPGVLRVTLIAYDFDAPASGTLLITSMTFSGTGGNPFTGGTAPIGRGDAFYFGYQGGGAAALYTGDNGLNVNGSPPGTIPVYSGSHRYIFTVTGTGSPIAFNFEDDDYDDNSNNNLVVTICGSGMAMSAL